MAGPVKGPSAGTAEAATGTEDSEAAAGGGGGVSSGGSEDSSCSGSAGFRLFCSRSSAAFCFSDNALLADLLSDLSESGIAPASMSLPSSPAGTLLCSLAGGAALALALELLLAFRFLRPNSSMSSSSEFH